MEMMTESPIVINVGLQAAPGYEGKLGSQLLAKVGPTRGEPGCMVYELHSDPENSAKFMFYEKFASQAALEDHLVDRTLQTLSELHSGGQHYCGATVTRWRKV
jgi:quinol monooxygenase YgiN